MMEIEKDVKLKYPLNYFLKLIFDNNIDQSIRKASVQNLFDQYDVPSGDFQVKISESERFITFTVQVLIINEEVFSLLYSGLKSLPGLRFAV
ncbi:MAG TPA: DUF493 family protein [Bacteroidales bacterium]|jgi:hypothetical protein|nr:DUF493 family protein [Bacteroidales bacterium]